MRRIFNSNIDFFPGFYQGLFDMGEIAYTEMHEEADWVNSEKPEWVKDLGRDYTMDDFDYDYKGAEKSVGEIYADIFKNYAPDCVESVEFDCISSPRFYNYSTDRLFVNMKLCPSWLSCVRQFMKDNYEWLKERIADDWSSYDGFISFIENDIDEWDRHLADNNDRDQNLYVFLMIEYMMLREDKNIADHLIEDTWEEFCPYEFVKFKDENVAEA